MGGVTVWSNLARTCIPTGNNYSGAHQVSLSLLYPIHTTKNTTLKTAYFNSIKHVFGIYTSSTHTVIHKHLVVINMNTYSPFAMVKSISISNSIYAYPRLLINSLCDSIQHKFIVILSHPAAGRQWYVSKSLVDNFDAISFISNTISKMAERLWSPKILLQCKENSLMSVQTFSLPILPQMI